MKRILDEIRKLLDNECYLAALSMAITIPDICGKAEYPELGVGRRYIQWYDKFFEIDDMRNDPDLTFVPQLTGEMAYNLRNNLLHQGSTIIEKDEMRDDMSKVDCFELIVSKNPIDDGYSYVSEDSDGNTERGLAVNVPMLCKKLVWVAERYYAENSNKFDFLYNRLIFRFDGDVKL